VTKHGLHVVLLSFPGGVTDEFTRKLQKWEEMKEKRSSGHFKGKRNNRLWMECTSLMSWSHSSKITYHPEYW